MKKQTFHQPPVLAALLCLTCGIWPACSAGESSGPTPIRITSLEQLAEYGGQSGNHIEMDPGLYRLIDYIPLEKIPGRRDKGEWHFLHLTGHDNVFDLTGVTIELDTQLRAALRAPIHNPEFVISGDNNVLNGLTITSVGDGTSNAGNLLSIWGHGNTLSNGTFHVQGSTPYGYGDLFGKGGPGVLPHRKHSGVQITGDNNRIIGCRLYLRSFGHGFFVQGGSDTYFEDCYVEGEVRSTDEMLAETSGRAFEVGFRSVYRNRQGENVVTPGYMKSLAEDAFRTYGNTHGVTFINCTAKNMRAGWELRSSGPIRIENCTSIANERGFWVGSDAIVRNSRGDAKYGPLLFLEGDGSLVELELMADESEMNVHSIATIHGSGHTVSILPWQGRNRSREAPILLAYSQPGGGEGMSPYGQRPARRVSLTNGTAMPVAIGRQAGDCQIESVGAVSDERAAPGPVR